MPSLRSLLVAAPLLFTMPCAIALAGEKIVVKAPVDARITIIFSQAVGVESPPVISVIVSPERRFHIRRRTLFTGFHHQFSGPKYPF